MTKVMYKLSDRNLMALSDNAKLPYEIRKMAAKLLEDRRKDMRLVELAK